MITEQDAKFIELAIEEAKQSDSEDSRTHPRVGAVVTKNEKLLGSSHRGEPLGAHAEYSILESKLKEEVLVGATIFTTLEPCTTRNHPKVPCAQRIIDRKIARVVIGMLDPNPKITGKGILALRKAGIEIDLFPKLYGDEVEELNRDFIRAQSSLGTTGIKILDEAFIERHRTRSLDDWYSAINYIYWDRNFNRDSMAIFTHLVEVTGGLSLLASSKKKPGIIAEEFVPKCIAWWLALCGKAGVKSVEDMLWAKFPEACTYCHQNPHDPDECAERKAENRGPSWETLANLGLKKTRPRGLGGWQRMFSAIYPAQQTEDFGPSFGRLTEELGELAEALRIFPAAPGYFLSEAADVFAWLMHVQNIIDQKKGTPKAERGKWLENGFCYAYPDRCLDCNQTKCSCPPILEETIGRIAHEVPTGRGSFEVGGSFMTVDKARQQFKLPTY
jgi:pyrimidine deaminase RibD-like protein